MTPSWVTAFLDLAPADAGAAVPFWQSVTGHGLSEPRGEHGEFATLLPQAGDPHLKVQRLHDGPSGVHLDVHVTDLAAAREQAERLGARLVADRGFAEMASPGGFAFCLVTEQHTTRAQPATWPGGHRSAVDQVCLDVPPGRWDAEVAFWSALTGWERRGSDYTEFASLLRPTAVPVRLLFQRLDDPQPVVTGHLDLASTDRRAEVERHVALGARVLEVRDHWTVLRPPAGPAYCVTDRAPDIGMTP